MRNAIEKNAKILALFAIGCTALVSVVNLLTQNKIIQQEQHQLHATLNSIVPPNAHNNSMYQDCIVISDPELSNGQTQKAYLARFDNNPVAAAIKPLTGGGLGMSHFTCAVGAMKHASYSRHSFKPQ